MKIKQNLQFLSIVFSEQIQSISKKIKDQRTAGNKRENNQKQRFN